MQRAKPVSSGSGGRMRRMPVQLSCKEHQDEKITQLATHCTTALEQTNRQESNADSDSVNNSIVD